MKKILFSASAIAVVAAMVVAGTGAFFSDEETSEGNVFTAGAIDLKIDNESYVTNNEGVLVASPETSWELDDLTDQLFFNFDDLKPGDVGEDTISLHVNNNDAWACMNVNITSTPENGQTEPEADVDGTSGTDEGELQDELNFVFWADDGDNVLEDDEVNSVIAQGTAGSLFNGEEMVLADSTGNAWEGNGPLQGGELEPVYYVGKAWCYGELTLDALSQDDEGKLGDNGPLDRGTGVSCSGSGVTNASQTDGVTADVTFTAVQSRNNSDFVCSSSPNVGANLSAYTAPSSCTVTVDDDGGADYETIQAAIDGESAGAVICVADGEYDEFVVDKGVTIAGLTNPNTGSAKVVPSGLSVTELALVLSSDVTITGLHFDGSGTSFTGSQTAGVQVSPSGSSVDNVNIVYNIIENLAATNSSASNKGIQWWTDTGSGFSLTNSVFSHNVIENITSTNKGGYGVQTVGDMDNVTISYNTISDIDGAWEAGVALDSKDLVTTTGVSVNNNHIMSGIETFSVQVEANVDGGGIVVNTNNIDTLLYGGSSGTPSPDTLDAENNWWGTATPAVGADVFLAPGSNTVDFAPAEASAFPLN